MTKLVASVDKEMRKKITQLCVLVVDDEAEIRLLIRDILKDIGVARTFEASDGKSALEFISTDFDAQNFIIISDWNMPGMTGIDFLKQLRKIQPDTPFLMLTGRGNQNSIIEAKAAGVSAYIRKPFSPKQLEEKLISLVKIKYPA
jgi:two-component system chemotaxis response regulator CheY